MFYSPTTAQQRARIEPTAVRERVTASEILKANYRQIYATSNSQGLNSLKDDVTADLAINEWFRVNMPDVYAEQDDIAFDKVYAPEGLYERAKLEFKGPADILAQLPDADTANKALQTRIDALYADVDEVSAYSAFGGLSSFSLSLAAGMGATITDPINIGATIVGFLPVVGPFATASRLINMRNAAASGFAMNAVSESVVQASIESQFNRLDLERRENPVTEVAFAALFGGTLSGIVGGLVKPRQPTGALIDEGTTGTPSAPPSEGPPESVLLDILGDKAYNEFANGMVDLARAQHVSKLDSNGIPIDIEEAAARVDEAVRAILSGKSADEIETLLRPDPTRGTTPEQTVIDSTTLNETLRLRDALDGRALTDAEIDELVFDIIERGFFDRLNELAKGKVAITGETLAAARARADDAKTALRAAEDKLKAAQDELKRVRNIDDATDAAVILQRNAIHDAEVELEAADTVFNAANEAAENAKTALDDAKKTLADVKKAKTDAVGADATRKARAAVAKKADADAKLTRKERVDAELARIRSERPAPTPDPTVSLPASKPKAGSGKTGKTKAEIKAEAAKRAEEKALEKEAMGIVRGREAEEKQAALDAFDAQQKDLAAEHEAKVAEAEARVKDAAEIEADTRGFRNEVQREVNASEKAVQNARDELANTLKAYRRIIRNENGVRDAIVFAKSKLDKAVNDLENAAKRAATRQEALENLEARLRASRMRDDLRNGVIPQELTEIATGIRDNAKLYNEASPDDIRDAVAATIDNLQRAFPPSETAGGRRFRSDVDVEATISANQSRIDRELDLNEIRNSTGEFYMDGRTITGEEVLAAFADDPDFQIASSLGVCKL